MHEQAFGGDWTEKKLDCLRNYLRAYRNVLKGKTFLRTWYVDAFAGTGSRVTALPRTESIFVDETYSDSQAAAYQDGSAKIALGLEDPFDHYLFIEKSRSKAQKLESVIESQFPRLRSRCQVKQADANSALREWCACRDWKKERAVVFLDPFGMQVDWDTVQMLGQTQAVDLWYLFPLGIATRLLAKDGQIPDGWKLGLDRLFGSQEWHDRFYRTRVINGLFGDTEEVQRDATVSNITGYIETQLKTCFSKTAPSLVLKNSNNSPLFALCFAVANERGADIAVRIAKHILK